MTDDTRAIVPAEQPAALAALGAAADQAAERHVFQRYQAPRPESTLRAQRSDLALFARFLTNPAAMEAADEAQRAAALADALYSGPEAWRGVSFGLVDGFREWLLLRGYAVGSVNRRLATVKRYASLAHEAGVMPSETLARIRGARGIAHKDAATVDERRPSSRRGTKKAVAVSISPEQADQLLTEHPDTPQGRRDALLMALLLEHGLRVSEVAALRWENFGEDEFLFYRVKVRKTQRHGYSRALRSALRRYREVIDFYAGPLLRASDKTGRLLEHGMSLKAISARVGTLGERVGLPGLSPHDCRHNWTTAALDGDTNLFRLQEAGGWSSLAMPRRYAQDAAVANEGVTLRRKRR